MSRFGRPFWAIGAKLMAMQPFQRKSTHYAEHTLSGWRPRFKGRIKMGKFSTRVLISLQGKAPCRITDRTNKKPIDPAAARCLALLHAVTGPLHQANLP